MKKYVIFLFVIFSTIGMFAQPQGGRRGAGGPPQGREMRQYSSVSENKVVLDHFPEIPGLTLEQREKVGSILASERKDIQSQIEKRRECEEKANHPGYSSKDKEKQWKQMEKIDKKIEDIKSKSDKKIKKILSEEQYLVFVKKRDEFKFKEQGRARPKGEGRPHSPFPPSERGSE
jgi:hypothetical protein